MTRGHPAGSLRDMSDEEAAAVDRAMDAHMAGHSRSNSPGYWSCDVGCRTRALAEAFRSHVLLPRRYAPDAEVRASARDAVLGVLGYEAETSGPNEQPAVRFYTDRWLSPRLDALADLVAAGGTRALLDALADAAAWLATLEDPRPHLKVAEEAAEFAADPSLEELADVLVCLAGAVSERGWGAAEIAAAVTAKMTVNRAREWARQEDGTWRHA